MYQHLFILWIFNSAVCWTTSVDSMNLRTNINTKKLQNRSKIGRNHSHTQRKVDVTDLSTKIVNPCDSMITSHSAPAELPPSGRQWSTSPAWKWVFSKRQTPKKTDIKIIYMKLRLHINDLYGCLPSECNLQPGSQSPTWCICSTKGIKLWLTLIFWSAPGCKITIVRKSPDPVSE